MGDPGLLQELPDIAARLPQAGGDGEQSTAADRTLTGLDAPAVAWQTSDLALNHRLAQGPYSCGEDFVCSGVVGGFNPGVFQKGPERPLMFCSDRDTGNR